MGLCKCRVVTNLFCFDHRTNVCEKCLVEDHPKCIVRTYLQWLQDSDYKSICTLCNGSLQQGDVVRLICYDVFHWACLDQLCRSMPPTTAPAGYLCPTCQVPIIPRADLASPVANALRERLVHTTWGKTEIPAFDTGLVRQMQAENGHAASVYVPDPSPAQSMYAQPGQRMQIKKDDSARKSVTAVSYLTRVKRKLGIRPLGLMGRDFTRITALVLVALVIYTIARQY